MKALDSTENKGTAAAYDCIYLSTTIDADEDENNIKKSDKKVKDQFLIDS
jgi:hypothetical protein